MKQFKFLTVLVLSVMMVTALAGCGKKAKITGTWTGQDNSTIQSLQLNEDGTGNIDLGDNVKVNLTYQTTADKLTISTTYLNTTENTEYTYTLKSNTLTLTVDNDTIVLKK